MFLPGEENLARCLGSTAGEEKTGRYENLLDTGIWQLRPKKAIGRTASRHVRGELATQQARKMRLGGDEIEKTHANNIMEIDLGGLGQREKGGLGNRLRLRLLVKLSGGLALHYQARRKGYFKVPCFYR